MTDPTKDREFFKTLLDNMQIGIIVTDRKGMVVYLNQTYARFLNIGIDESLGKHATDIVNNTRLHIVAETGQAEINHPHKFRNSRYIVHRIPIRKAGRIIAVMGLVLFDSATTAIKLAEKLVSLETKLKSAQNELASLYATRYCFADIVTCSAEMEEIKNQAIRAAHSELSVLITGESGTGKELFAQSIHHEGPRKAYPFVRVNCAAIPRELFESELFGYEKGAFSGAHPKGKAGKFELAHLGTIFLDEVGELPIEMQPKLLRVLELKEFERVGGNRLISSDFRVIAATNLDLGKAMDSGSFRRDLYYRLSTIPLHISPLRCRREDIGCLARHFLEKLGADRPAGKINIDSTAIRHLEAFSWPGNGRELLHVLQQAVFTMAGETLNLKNLPEYIQIPLPSPPERVAEQPLKAYMRVAERQAIVQVMNQTDWNMTSAAQILGIHRTLLYRKMKQLDISIRSNLSL